MRNWRAKNKDHVKEINRRSNRRLKQTIFEVYGNKCVCCGEDRLEFLTIDHVNGHGNQHRKEVGGSGAVFYRWLIKNDFPQGYQALCHNCNFSKSAYGYCPHKEIGKW